MRMTLALVGAPLALLLAVAPVAANETARWTDTQPIENTYSCGVVEHTVQHLDGTAFFDGTGSWIRDVVRYSYDASFSDPSSGRTISYKTRQILEVDQDTGTFRGQGFFIRVPGRGVVLFDVGRLVFSLSDGSTLSASAKVIRFDDPVAPEVIDAAVCSLF